MRLSLRVRLRVRLRRVHKAPWFAPHGPARDLAAGLRKKSTQLPPSQTTARRQR